MRKTYTPPLVRQSPSSWATMFGRVGDIAHNPFVFYLTAGFALCNLATALIMGFFLDKSYHETRQEAAQLARSYTQILDLSISSLEQHVDIGLRDVAQILESQTVPLTEPVIAETINRTFQLLPKVDSLRFADDAGRVIHEIGGSSTLTDTVADREFFLRARAASTGTLIIAKPLPATTPESRIVVLARRVNRPGGAFAGVIYASIALRTFLELFDAIPLGPRGVILLLRPDREVIAYRAEKAPATYGINQQYLDQEFLNAWQRNEVSGVFTSTGSEDKVYRLTAYRRIAFSHGYVVVGLADSDFMAEWRLNFRIMAAVVIVVVALSGFACWLLYSGWRRLDAMNQRLNLLASTDPLTGCANRRQFMSELANQRARSARQPQPFSILSLDIDHFKYINDSHGHQGGDETLCHLVKVVERVLRTTDLLGRVGGEEFVILLPETGLVPAIAVAERIRAMIASSPLMLKSGPIILTASIGVAEWRADIVETTDALLIRADMAMYAAKHGGRNRVMSEDDIVPIRPPSSTQAWNGTPSRSDTTAPFNWRSKDPKEPPGDTPTRPPPPEGPPV